MNFWLLIAIYLYASKSIRIFWKVPFLSFRQWRLSLERMDSFQNSVVNCHGLSKEEIFLKVLPSTSGSRSHYLLLLDKAWHLKTLHNSDHIWISKANRSSTSHRHWNFVVSTIELLGLGTAEAWISYPRPETIPSRECGWGCPVLKPRSVHESCSMPVALSIREQSQPCLIY